MTPTPDFIVAIPARHDATRLPGKPLRLLGGEPLVLHVARRALAAGAREVWVAADDARIAQALEGSGVRVAMTSSHHASGSDRLAECADIAGWADDALVVNLQGDEPFAPASGIRAAAGVLVASGADMATLAAPIDEADTLFDPNAVKVVCGVERNAQEGGDTPVWRNALYFSRAPVPWHRDAFADDQRAPQPDACLRHIGLYAYRAGFLRRFTQLPAGVLERIESLEQLRALEHGYRIAVALASEPFPPGVDTAEDLARAESLLAAMRASGAHG